MQRGLERMKKQVDKSHYEFAKYLHKGRWASMWHQLDEVVNLAPDHVLEVGPGPGIFKANAATLGFNVETLDIDPELNPDHVGSVFDMPFDDGTYDVVCAFQMLEHLPWEDSKKAFREMARVARIGLVVSLPDAAVRWPMSIHVPRIGALKFSMPKPRIRARKHEFDGEHYWEINKYGYSLHRVKSDFLNAPRVKIVKSYRVHEHLYHRFFVLKKM